ncbi:MAG: signal peptidase I [Planctomycetes bacterium]|nr:signal peptidase I [Planctomycetota bacterium]
MNFTSLSVLAQEGSAEGPVGAVILLVPLVVIILLIVGTWKVFEKAGKPGWGQLIPIYNIVLLLEIVGKPIWWILLLLIPPVNFVVALILSIELAKCFGKSAGFGIGLLFLGFIFFPILGFSDAKYRGPQKG